MPAIPATEEAEVGILQSEARQGKNARPYEKLEQKELGA
jgi:hypothetical protein